MLDRDSESWRRRAGDTPQPLGLPILERPRLGSIQNGLPRRKWDRKDEQGLIRDAQIGAMDVRLLDEITTIVSTAGAAILATRAGGLEVRTKPDHSPVTAADRAAEAAILDGLARVLPGVAVVSEEAGMLCSALPDRFILVDPLDGTREFIAGRDEFTVNVAIVAGGRPQLGVVAAPAQGLLWRGVVGMGSERLRLVPGRPASAADERKSIHTRAAPHSGLVAAASRSHLDPATQAFLSRLSIEECVTCGSAVKFCQVAEGVADVYPRLSTTCEWDVAAGHALLVAAGGTVTTPDGRPLGYGRHDANFRVPAFVAWGDPSAPARFGVP
jgi:3'(2'), 5'-bisphosphate nucleotidase